MKKKLGLFLAAVMVLNTISSAAFAWENPLKKYNLYEDVMGGNNSGGEDYERVMDDYNSNSLRSGSSAMPADVPSYDDDSNSEFAAEKTRNETLRESAGTLYADHESPAAWEEGPSYYPNPSFESIVAKYRASDFAGCLQECISYVRQNPNDTLGFYYLAMCYTKVSDKDNAIRAYEQVIMLNDNPMIVKYATNGRNCVMQNGQDKCYENVNEPELIHPYANIANTMDLTPVDPEVLVNENLAKLKNKLSPIEVSKDNEKSNSKDKDDKDKINLPFGRQDEKLDEFINAPYGNGLSPELNKEYKQLQLKKLQQTINKGGNSDETKYNNLKDIKKFDNQKSESGSIKLAYENPEKIMQEISKDPEYIKQKQELEELNMLLGNDKSKDSTDITELLPYMSESGEKKLSPEVIQTMMINSLMSDITL